MSRIVVSIWLCLAFMTGCSDSEGTKLGPVSPVNVKNVKPFRLGLIPERNIFSQLEHYQPLADYLSERLGKKVELKILARYGNIIENFVSAGLDAAFFGSFTFTLANAKLGIEVIARPESPSGISTYHGLIFTRKDSGIKSIKEMKDKSFAMVDKATTAGYIFPLAFFKRNGILDYETFLKEVYFTGTHEDAIYDVLNKKADIGAAKNTIFYFLANEDKRLITELLILEKSLDVPENGLAVRKDLDPFIKDQLKNILLNMRTDPKGIEVLKKFGSRAFIETSENDYGNVRTLVQKAGLDLKTYDYMNE